MLVHCRVTLSVKFAGTHLYTLVERGTVRVKCLAHKHKVMSLAIGLKPRPLDPEMSAVTMRPLCLPCVIFMAVNDNLQPHSQGPLRVGEDPGNEVG